jgi:hypothetical protein
VIYIKLDVGVPVWKWLLTIDLPAFLWLGMTLLHYRHSRTKGTAWLFALFPVAFLEPALGAVLWISSLHLGRYSSISAFSGNSR